MQGEPEIDYLNYIIKISKTIQMWPVEDQTKSKKFYHFSVWCTFIYCCVMVGSLLFHIILNYGNMDGVVDTIDHATVFISGTFRYIFIYLNGKKYLRLVELVRKKFIRRPFFAEENVNTLHEYYNTAKRIIISYNTPIFFWISQAMTLPLIKFTSSVISDSLRGELNVTQIPFQPPLFGYFPMDITRMPGGIVFYLWEGYAVVVIAIIYAFVDNFWVMVLFLTMGQLDIIKMSIESLSAEAEERTLKEDGPPNENDLKALDEKLMKCIHHHQFLRKFIKFADNLLNLNVLIDYFHAIISIAFLMLEVTVTLKIGAWGRFAHSFQFLLVSICHLFIFDWIGHELAAKEEAICNALYGLRWYKFPKKKDKILIPTLICGRPFRLSGGRTFRLSLEFFTSTIKIIFSYFTFLLQMRNKGENEFAY